MPYLISGGILGLALVVLGGFLYFAHWLTQLIKETRAQANTMASAMERLEELLSHQLAAAPNAVAAVATSGARRALVAPVAVPTLVATPKGNMAHRPDCVVVGKEGLRAVEPGEDLAPCKLCDSGAV